VTDAEKDARFLEIVRGAGLVPDAAAPGRYVHPGDPQMAAWRPPTGGEWVFNVRQVEPVRRASRAGGGDRPGTPPGSA
jgi:hypothetical protein